MGGACQHDWEHAVPKVRARRAADQHHLPPRRPLTTVLRRRRHGVERQPDVDEVAREPEASRHQRGELVGHRLVESVERAGP